MRAIPSAAWRSIPPRPSTRPSMRARLSISAATAAARNSSPIRRRFLAAKTPSVTATSETRDPVCGMKVDPATAKHKAEHAGETYYFCSGGCREKFVAEPARYLKPKSVAPPPKPAPTGTIYTCPMHPQIRQVGPGNCPICGMALEPETVTADAGPNAELIDMTRRLWIGLILAVPVIALEMGGHLTNLHMWLPAENLELDSARARDASRLVGRLAILSARMGLARQPQSQHVHPDRHGHGRRLDLQRGRDGRARLVSSSHSRSGWRGRDLFRGGGGDYRPRAPWPGPRIACARTNRRRDPGSARSGAENRSPHPRRQRG